MELLLLCPSYSGVRGSLTYLATGGFTQRRSVSSRPPAACSLRRKRKEETEGAGGETWSAEAQLVHESALDSPALLLLGEDEGHGCHRREHGL